MPAAAVVDCATDARVYTTSLRVIRTQIALHLVSVRVRVFLFDMRSVASTTSTSSSSTPHESDPVPDRDVTRRDVNRDAALDAPGRSSGARAADDPPGRGSGTRKSESRMPYAVYLVSETSHWWACGPPGG